MKEDKPGEYETWLNKFGGYAKSMTLRDYFAVHAIGVSDATLRPAYTFQEKAEYAYMMADAMLEARK